VRFIATLTPFHAAVLKHRSRVFSTINALNEKKYRETAKDKASRTVTTLKVEYLRLE
jgi:hypothetical protein